MGDIIALLGHLNLSPINTGLLAVILWLIWRLFQKFELLEGSEGTLNQLRERLSRSETRLAVLEKVQDITIDFHEGRGGGE